MKILMLEWDSFGNKHIKKAFIKRGIEIVSMEFSIKREDTRVSEELATRVVKNIQENGVDIVFSFNYFPVVAIAAAACKIKYLSWTYDSPYIQIYSKTIEYPSNYAFVFDKAEYYNLISKGVNTVHYLPMAADTDYYDSIVPSESDKKRYSADVAMVGSMYSEKKHDLIRHFDGLDDYTSGYLSGLMDAQKQLYGVSILEKGLTSSIVSNIQKVCPMTARGDGLESIEWVFANYFVARKLTAIERKEYLEALSDKFDVALYTPEATPELKKVHNRGSLEYYSDAPKAFKCAKININISLRSIISGIPLRCLDIMGCGGFLLTNYQSDFEEFFEAGKDYVYFESKEDLIEKTQYYLSHEDERIRIAKSGYEKVKLYHNFDRRVEEMLNTIHNPS